MKILQTPNYVKISKRKYPKEETEPYNPWAVCNKSTSGKKEEPEKFERCVNHLKDKNKEDNKMGKLDETKDVKRVKVRNRNDYKADEPIEQKFDRNLSDDLSGKTEEERERELNDKFNDIFRRQSSKTEDEWLKFLFDKK